MGAVMKLLSEFYTTSLVYFSLLFLETLTLVRSFTGLNPKPAAMTAADYFTLMDQRSPPEPFSVASTAGDSPECTVCLSELEDGDEIRRLRCGHVYHMACLDTWLQGCGATCPLCRARLLPDHFRRPPEEAEFDGSDEEEIILFLSAAIQGGSVFHSLYF